MNSEKVERLEAVFISDLHLSPKHFDIDERLDRFLRWAEFNAQSLYILGDLFELWVGDDDLTEWNFKILKKFNSLSQKIPIYYMVGNRDFLFGKKAAKLAGFKILKDPTVLKLSQLKVLLAHGDFYCKSDKAHQVFRLITRSKLFIFCFLKLSLTRRRRLAEFIRAKSKKKQETYKSETLAKDQQISDGVSVKAVLSSMRKAGLRTLIHGHTHRFGLSQYQIAGETFERYVMSDWDLEPKFLCYQQELGLFFKDLPYS